MLTTSDQIKQLNQYAELIVQEKLLAERYDQRISEIVAERDRDPEFVEAVRQRQALEQEIENGARELQAGAKGKEFRVVYRNAPTYRRWDLDKLDALKISHPDVWHVILPFRQEVSGKSSVTIEPLKKDKKDDQHEK